MPNEFFIYFYDGQVKPILRTKAGQKAFVKKFASEVILQEVHARAGKTGGQMIVIADGKKAAADFRNKIENLAAKNVTVWKLSNI